jgi:hypothetical protein
LICKTAVLPISSRNKNDFFGIAVAFPMDFPGNRVQTGLPGGHGGACNLAPSKGGWKLVSFLPVHHIKKQARGYYEFTGCTADRQRADEGILQGLSGV